MIRVNKYRVTTKHDNGILNLIVTSTSKPSAIKMTMDAEKCPRRAIKKVERLKPRWEVQTRFGDEWENCWQDTAEDGTETPTTYATKAEALEAIAETLQTVSDAVKAGDMAEKYSRRDYRVRPTWEGVA